MYLTNAVRATAIEMAREMYDAEFTQKLLSGSSEDIDERLQLEDLVSRVECEIRLAVEELEFNVSFDDEDEDE